MGTCVSQSDESGAILFSGSIVTVTLEDSSVLPGDDAVSGDQIDNEDGVVLAEPEDEVTADDIIVEEETTG